MTIIKGKANITAEVVCDSVSSVDGKRITTFSLEYPRIVHSEFMTHRMISRNAASSRAIPFEKMIENLNGIPVRFGAANKGMQDKGEDHTATVGIGWSPEEFWDAAKESAVELAECYYREGYAKQVYNRLLEPFQMMKTIATATEWQNFFWLRDDEAADPTIQELARCMKEAMDESTPQVLAPGEWHLPFVDRQEFGEYSIKLDVPCLACEALSLEDAIIISCARCAAVSFRNVDYNIAKCKEVYDRLINGGKVHGSSLEHCATPMEDDGGGFNYNKEYTQSWPKGFTHMDKESNMWSGNFQGFVQYRQLIPNESKKG